MIQKLKQKWLTTPAGWSTEPKERLSYYSYFIGQNGVYQLVATSLTTYFLFLGVNPMKSGAVMMAVKIWDAVNDAIFGMIFDTIHFKSGKKYTPWMKVATAAIPITTILLFTIPRSGSEAFQLGWFAVAYLLWDAAFTFCDVPIFGVITAMSENVDERNSILSYKSIWSGVGSAACTALATVVISEFIGGTYTVVAIAVGIIALVSMIPACRNVKERFVSPPEEQFGIRAMFKYLFHNKNLLIYYLGYFFYSSALVGTSVSLFTSYYVFNSSLYAMIVGVCEAVPAFLCAILVPQLIRKVDKMKVYRLAALLTVIFGVLLWTLGRKHLAFFIGFSVLKSISFNTSGTIMYIFTADCATYGRYKTGIEANGITFSIQAFMTKLTAAIAGSMGLAILGLSYTGWTPIENAENFEDLSNLGITQSAHAVNVLWFIYTMIPAIGCFIAYIIWHFYKLNDKDVQVMLDCNTGKITKEEAENALSRKY